MAARARSTGGSHHSGMRGPPPPGASARARSAPRALRTPASADFFAFFFCIIFQCLFKTPQEASKTAQDAAKTPTRRPKTPREASKK